jgi:hypothetical protein
MKLGVYYWPLASVILGTVVISSSGTNFSFRGLAVVRMSYAGRTYPWMPKSQFFCLLLVGKKKSPVPFA